MGELEAENHLIASGLLGCNQIITDLGCNQIITDLVKGLATPRQTHGEELKSQCAVGVFHRSSVYLLSSDHYRSVSCVVYFAKYAS